MAQTLKKLPNAQYTVTGVFEFNWDDSMANIAGVTVAMGKVTSAGDTTFDIMTPPPGSYVVGGSIIIPTAVVGPTVSTLSLGDSDLATRFATTHNLLTTTGLALSGILPKVYNGAQAIRATINNTVAVMSAGKVVVSVTFAVPGKAHENLKTV